MPGPLVEKLDPPAKVPDSVDTVVIGGGVIGLFTALELCERGFRVALCEKGEVGAEQSSRNWGWVRVLQRDPREIELVLAAHRLWQVLESRLQESVGYSRPGIVYTAASQRQRTRQEAWLSAAEPYDIQARIIEKAELQLLFPGAILDGESALYCAEDGRAEPQLVAPAVARRCRRLGVSVMPRCAARAIETCGGKVSSVVTELGEIRCHAAVVAAGAWSSLFCGNMNLSLPQLKVRSSVLRTEPTSGNLEPGLGTSGFSVRKRADGGLTVASSHRNLVEIVPDSFRYFRQFLPALRSEWDSLSLRIGSETLREIRQETHWKSDAISPFEKLRILDPEPVSQHPLQALKNLGTAFPQFRGIRVKQMWAGMIDATPDAIPVISAVDSVPGLHIATGFSGHGFGISPGAGRLMADIVSGQAPIVDPYHFRYSRFSDGSTIRPGSL